MGKLIKIRWILHNSLDVCVGTHVSHFIFQKSCIDFTIQARPLERYMPKERNSMKYKIWRIVMSTPFEYFIMILIVLNTLLLMMKVSILGNEYLDHWYHFRDIKLHIHSWSTYEHVSIIDWFEVHNEERECGINSRSVLVDSEFSYS